MQHQEFSFNIYNTKFYGQYFTPKTVNNVIVLVHGMGEHSSRYSNFVIPHFLTNNSAVITYDHFGHGKTEGKRGHNPGFEAVLDSVEETIKKSKEIFGDKPTFLYGHSMGGNVVMNYVLRRKNDLTGVISTSPFLKLGFKPPKWKMAMGKAMLKIAPSITVNNELDTEGISRDKNVVKAYINDPLNHDKVSLNFSILFMDTAEWAIQNAAKLDIPMLLMHGTADRLTNYKGSEEFAKNAGKNVDLKLWEGGYHELHNDIIKNEVVDEMTNWINTQLKN